MKIFSYICLLLIANGQLLIAQNIPIGTWRSHVSFSDVHAIGLSPSTVYAAAPNGIMVLDVTGNNLSTLTKQDGLSSTNITCVAFDTPRNQLLVTYNDGDVDIVRNNEIINFSTLKNATTITGSKRINHIAVLGSLAYLSTDFGVVVFDLIQLAIKETWRDIGVAGAGMRINQSTFYNDSIFLATEHGVLAGDLADNLMDFNNWKRFNTGVFNATIPSVTAQGVHVYAAVNGSGLYAYQYGAWTLKDYLQGLQYKNITSGGSLKVIAGNTLYRITSGEVATAVTSDKITVPHVAVEDVNGKLWIGDQQNGLVTDHSNVFESYAANGPTFSGGLRLAYSYERNAMIALSGGYTTALAPLGITEPVNSFSTGNWKTEPWLDHDVTDFKQAGEKIFVASASHGVQQISGSITTLWDETNSPLSNVAAGRNVRVTALALSAEGLWVTNAGATQPLHLLKHDNTWESFSFPLISAARYPTHIVVDHLGQVWMVLSPAQGGGILVFNKTSNQSVYLTDAVGVGALPSRLVYAIAVDRDGFVWAGTAAGAAYFADPYSIFSGNVTAIKPVFGSRFLLRDERVTAIEIDGGNRKWMGSDNGLWLFNPYGEEQVHHFNTTNSPMLTNKVVDLEINGQSGELFVITDAGMVSYRSDATLGNEKFQPVKIFPNPVTNAFNGQVGISGIVTDAIVKITDAAGKLVWQSRANGGSVSWNVRDYNGRRAATGMYLVFCIAPDGSESVVGKIAIVN